MKSEEIKKLEKKRKHLQKWLRRVKKAQDTVPQVQINLELVNWQIEALANPPDEASEIPLIGLSSTLDQDTNYWIGALTMIPKVDGDLIMAASAITTTGTQSIYEFVTRVGDLPTPGAIAYTEKYTTLYHQLHITQNRPEAVRSLIEKLNNPQTLERFDEALKAYLTTKAGTEKHSTAGKEMRNLLDGVKGDLFKIARKWPKENMNWQVMAERLVIGEVAGMEYHELINQGPIRSSLIDRLSDILKEREGGSFTNLDNVWTQVLDHIYITLGLIKFPDT
ncbi:MAG: hypothetical protein L0Y56_08830 [Nitrospira sp.]|nr:hypothetical protein [Nitrospira sp.]